ncbi:hypothetical protein [Desulfosediminicola ganghwensis]|uniref:hypothetical protein n=1 Tax=Desulfosediminicola ganghwensis TaxID=2569540 RepID=UPI0010AD69D4|nr:hypothetical protein [Desulfosediminicola ganghwensis]
MIDWNKQITAHWKLIDVLAVRRFGKGTTAEEAALFVVDKLLADDCSRLKKYAGKADLSAFIATVCYRLLEDFARSRFGRKRAPLWIRNLGGFWLKLYRLLCLERLDIAESVAAMDQQSRYSREINPGVDIEEAAWIIRQQVVDCGAHQGLEVELEQADADGDNKQNDNGRIPPPRETLERQQREEMFRMLFTIMTDVAEEVVEGDLNRLCSLQIELNPEEKLLLKLCYQDGMNVTQAGQLLGLNRHQAHGRLRRLLSRLRDDFDRAGLAEEILGQLR